MKTMGKWNKNTFKDKWKEDETTDYWLNEWDVNGDLYYNEFSRVRTALGIFHWDSLIEIGCGIGKNLEMIKSSFKPKELVGTDINGSFLYKAESKGLTVGARDTEYFKTNQAFDVMLSYEHLQHLHPEAYSNAVKAIKKAPIKYMVIYEGYKERPMVIKAGGGGRWAHEYEKDFGGEVVYKKIFKNNYILLVIKL